MKRFVPLFFLVLASLSAQAQKSDKPPYVYDESYLDPSFVEFKNQLTVAVVERDTVLMRSLFADSVISAGSGDHWVFSPNQIQFEKWSNQEWEEYAHYIRFGFERRTIPPEDDLPYYYPKYSMERFEFGSPSYSGHMETYYPDSIHAVHDYKGVRVETIVVLGENVNIRSAPSLKAPIVRKTTYGRFEMRGGFWADAYEKDIELGHDQTWIAIQLPGEKIGYIASQFTSEQWGSYMSVGKINGQWKIYSFWDLRGC